MGAVMRWLVRWVLTPRHVAYAVAMDPNVVQVAAAAYEDGTESGSTVVTGGASPTLVSGTTYQLRFEIDETANNNFSGTAQLEYNHNSGGWNDVTAASSVVRATATANIADDATTTNRLSGTGSTFTAGRHDEGNGQAVIPDAGSLKATHTEMLYSVQIRTADVSDSDTILLRVRDTGGVTITYTVTMTVTVSVPGTTLTPGQATTTATAQTAVVQKVYYDRGDLLGFVDLPGTNEYVSASAGVSTGTGDIEVIVGLSKDDWTPAATQELVTRFDSVIANRVFRIRNLTSGALQYQIRDSVAGDVFFTTGAVSYTDTEWLWLRFRLDVDTGASNAALAIDSISGLRATDDPKALTGWTNDFNPAGPGHTISLQNPADTPVLVGATDGGGGISGFAAMSVAYVALWRDGWNGAGGTLAFEADWRDGPPSFPVRDDEAGFDWQLVGTAPVYNTQAPTPVTVSAFGATALQANVGNTAPVTVTAQPAAVRKDVTAAQASTTATALASTAVKTYPATLATTQVSALKEGFLWRFAAAAQVTATAHPAVAAKTYPATQGLVTATAQAATAQTGGPVVAGLASETLSALAATAAKTYPATQATSTLPAFGAAPVKTYPASLATTQVSALKEGFLWRFAAAAQVAVNALVAVAVKTFTAAQGLVTATAQPVVVADTSVAGLASTAVTAQPVTVARLYGATQPTVTATAQPASLVPTGITAGLAVVTMSASRAGPGTGQPFTAGLSELASSDVLGGAAQALTVVVAARPSTTATAQPVTVAKTYPATQAATTWTGSAVVVSVGPPAQVASYTVTALAATVVSVLGHMTPTTAELELGVTTAEFTITGRTDGPFTDDGAGTGAYDEVALYTTTAYLVPS